MTSPGEPVSDVGHWEGAWTTGRPERRGWYQPEPEPSLSLILEHTPAGGRVIDVGGGASLLVDRLLDRGLHPTVVDLAASSLTLAKHRLGSRSDEVTWVSGDVTSLDLGEQFDTWHDRAVLHFLLAEVDRTAYVRTLRAHLAIGGHAVIGTFAPDGPETCSGLPVLRQSSDDLAALLGEGFALIHAAHVVHTTPHGTEQAFTFVVFLREA